jgi:GntR family transcriptional regulator, transcriptional repressor for pyruvate dehydrogenase complex
MNLRESRPVEAATQLLEEIVAGHYPSGSRLPTETALCERLNVSRATLREAMKSLQQRGVIRIEQGRGSFVNPRGSWSALDPLLMAARSGAHDGATEEWSRKLRDARQLVEVGVAELAAVRRTEADVAALTEALDAMRVAHEADDVVAFTRADLAFHRALSQAVDNELIAALFDPMAHLIEQERLRTSRSVDRRQAAIGEHELVLRAVSAGQPRAARRNMARHIEATYQTDPGPTASFVDQTKGRRGA